MRNLVPLDETKTLGTPQKRWAAVYAKDMVIDNLDFAGDLLPETAGEGNVGNAEKPWSKGYFGKQISITNPDFADYRQNPETNSLLFTANGFVSEVDFTDASNYNKWHTWGIKDKATGNLACGIGFSHTESESTTISFLAGSGEQSVFTALQINPDGSLTGQNFPAGLEPIPHDDATKIGYHFLQVGEFGGSITLPSGGTWELLSMYYYESDGKLLNPSTATGQKLPGGHTFPTISTRVRIVSAKRIA